MSTSAQHPKPNIVKLGPPVPSSATKDNAGTEGVNFYLIEIFIKYYTEYIAYQCR